MAINVRPLSDSFALVSRLDPALDSDRDDFENLFRVATETLDFAPLFKPGEKPTVFRFRPVSGSIMRRLIDSLGLDFGPMHAELAFRLGLVAIENLAIDGAPKVERATDEAFSHLGPMVKRDVVDFLDAVTVAIGQPFGALVHELGSAVLQRSLTPSGK